MENKELYPELAAYIWDYCGRMNARKVRLIGTKLLLTELPTEIG
jgi:hypothetical protein